jgi:hypothetical protein
MNYADLLTKAAISPEALTEIEFNRLKPDDRAHLVGRMMQLCAAIDASIAGLRVSRKRVGQQRQLELVALAKRGKLRVTALSDDEQDAINNTPGLWDRLWGAWQS